MKSLLFISPVFPDPNGAGREKRAYQWIQKLKEEYQIHMLVIRTEMPLKEHPDLDVMEITVIEKESSLFGWVPLTRAGKMQLREHFRHARFDKILCFRLYLTDYAVYLKNITGCAQVELDLDDIESSTHLKIAHLYRKYGQMKRALLFYLMSLNFRGREKRLGTHFRDVYVCSDDDKALLSQKLKNVSFHVMPNRLSGSPKSLPLPGDRYQLLFIGSLDYFPNKEAVSWFIQEVLPQLRGRNKNWVLHVVGHSSSKAFKDLVNNTTGVHYHGRIEDIEGAYSKAYQVISPLHAGGGTKLKIIEAMWYGRPIVATPESVYGLGLTPYKHYLPAEDADSFIASCELAARDAELANTLVSHAREILLEKYHF